MVRFIIQFMIWHKNNVDCIYIPIWLDLLSGIRDDEFLNANIYIPIWLDLLSKSQNLTL